VVDNSNNSVGFLHPESLGLLAETKFDVDGAYLIGAMGLDYLTMKYIYLWFSNGTIILIDGMLF
jgi:hypothetical protein